MDDRAEPPGKVVKIGQVHEVDIALPITLKMRAYYSSYHLWAARHLAELVKNIEAARVDRPRFDIKHRAYVTNSVFSAVSFLEAAINELFQDVADAHESYVAGLDSDSKRIMSEFWNFTEGRNRSAFSLLDKYQMALTFLRKPQFEPGQPPYQDASLVVRLRNELVHYKPRSLGGDAEHTLARQLGGKFADNALMAGSGNPWFPDKCLGHGCADWSVRSVVALADNFFGRIGVDPNYQRVQFQPSQDET
jgi:hypothetical protein